MRRRRFIQSLLSLLGLSGLAPVSSKAAAAVESQNVLLQTSPVAGFQYHAGEAVWALLACGCDLDLVREPENPYDEKAVRIDWCGNKLGYVPRLENHAVAQLMDRGELLSARVAELRMSADPWERIQIEILWRVQGCEG